MQSSIIKTHGPQKKALRELGSKLREYRKRMKISAVAVAEASEISRITLYRIELGEASVKMGAYINVIHALGLKLELSSAAYAAKTLQNKVAPQIPKSIRIADYRQLKKLAWQLKGTKAAPKPSPFGPKRGVSPVSRHAAADGDHGPRSD